MSSTPTPSEASGSQTGLVPALLCQKCGEATNMASSSATGRNPLLRACNGCCATEKWLNRSLAKPKGRDETEEEKARRLNAQKIKDELKATRRPKTGRSGLQNKSFPEPKKITEQSEPSALQLAMWKKEGLLPPSKTMWRSTYRSELGQLKKCRSRCTTL